MHSMQDKITKAKQALSQAKALLVTTGAGMGVDSGLPDFRGNQGFWKAYPPMQKIGVSFAQMANPQWFVERPRLAWGFYGHRLHLYRDTVPHQGHDIVLRFAQDLPGGIFVFTSNVDGQFIKAGLPESSIYEVHGSIHHLQCLDACTRDIWSADNIAVGVNMNTMQAQDPLPECPHCRGLARPNILMFGDWGWLSQRSHEQEQNYTQWLRQAADLDGTKLVIIELGAGEAVPTVRMESEQMARRLNATLIRINPRDHHGPPGSIGLAMGALQGLRAIFE